MTVDHRTICGDALAGANPHKIADPHLINRQFQFLGAAHDARGLRLQVQQALHRLGTSRLHDE